MPDPAPDHVAVLRQDREFRVLAARSFDPGDAILEFAGVEVERPSPSSIQLDIGRHLDVPPGLGLRQTLDEHPWRFLNHSCDPNSALRDHTLVALRPIAPWEEVTFDYNTTEWEMTTPFRCVCGSDGCTAEEVRGFRFLSDDARERLRSRITAHLLRWWEQQRAG